MSAAPGPAAAAAPANAGFLPEVGVTIPVWLVRAGMAATMAAICVVVLGLSPLLVVGLLLVAAVLVLQRVPAAWLLILILAIAGLGDANTAPGAAFYVTLAGAHAIHEFGMLAAWLPRDGRVQRSVLGHLIRRYVLVQAPVQIVAFPLLGLLYPASGASVASPLFGIVAGLALIALVVFVVVPIIRERRKD